MSLIEKKNTRIATPSSLPQNALNHILMSDLPCLKVWEDVPLRDRPGGPRVTSQPTVALNLLHKAIHVPSAAANCKQKILTLKSTN